MTPDNWYGRFNDLIRSTIVCKFIDGPSFLAHKLMEFGEHRHNRSCRQYSQQQEIGYYAFHFYAKFDVSVADVNWNPISTQVDVEIQLTTQLQDILKDMTHSYYEKSRLSPSVDGSWKWNYESDNFKASYMSHTLHMLEAILFELREKHSASKGA